MDQEEAWSGGKSFMLENLCSSPMANDHGDMEKEMRVISI